MKTTSQNTTSQRTSQVWDIRGQNLPTPKPKYISRYIYLGFVRFFGRLPHPLPSPLLGGLGGFWDNAIFDRRANTGGSAFRWRKPNRAQLRTNLLPDTGSVRVSYTG